MSEPNQDQVPDFSKTVAWTPEKIDACIRAGLYEKYRDRIIKYQRELAAFRGHATSHVPGEARYLDE